MAPARPRVVDDARSETSLTHAKERVSLGTTVTKLKKTHANGSNGASNTSKAASASNPGTTAGLTSNGAVEADHELPHIDWTTFPVSSLHSYRSAYRLQIPSSYTRSHAEILYKSCDLALRSPSQVLARRKAHDLKQYRKQQAQQAAHSKAQTNGISKSAKARSKETRRSTARQKGATDSDTALLPSIEEPPSPTSHPSNRADSSSNPTDNASRKSPTATLTSSDQPHPEPEEPLIPISLNQSNPDSTVLGPAPSQTLTTTLRKHFNAQQLNEAETIARFTYVVRQQGSTTTTRTPPLAQRVGVLPLPATTAENIAAVAEQAALNPAGAAALTAITNASGAVTSANTNTATGGGAITQEKGKGNAHTAHSISTTRLLGGHHVEVEGGFGDGRGGIMGTTSCGREVRVLDGGGTGTFRLRFRP